MSVALLVSCTALSACDSWLAPKNANDFPKWHYCNRRPNDGQTKYSYMASSLPPADVAPHTCTSGRTLRHDSAGIICANYALGDEYGGVCTDQQCCAEEICNTYTCKTGKLRSDASSISCPYFPCNDFTCCDAVDKAPKHDAQGIVFVDLDPDRFRYGGKMTVLRAVDETDITHYNVYWGFAKTVRKVPSCGLKNPISWEQFKFTDNTRLLVRLNKTGCDITYEIPMGTSAEDVKRCKISYDRLDRTTAANDACNPHYLIVVAANEHGEKPFDSQSQQLGPRHPISDYEKEFGPCAEGGVTMGHDLPGPDDIVLGEWGKVSTAQECAQLCRDHSGSTGPCRYWNWAFPTGGHTAKTCWMETQSLQKAHYGVRIVGPAVCPTKPGSNPTGIERPRCNRWVRHVNKVFFDPDKRGIYTDRGNAYNQPPSLPDVPLGPYDNPDYCKTMCDMDVLCIGFTFMKKDQSDTLFHKCILIHKMGGSDTLRSSGYYDTFMCSREGMAPLIDGYSLLEHPFGFKTCSEAPVATQNVADHDCCAALCTGEAKCKYFTLDHGSMKCSMYSTCTEQSHDKQNGCAFESCFSTYGKASYQKHDAKMSIVDTWPDTGGNPQGITIAVQATHLEGASVKCAVSRDTSKTSVPGSMDDINKISSDLTHTGSISDSVFSATALKDIDGSDISDGTDYTIVCFSSSYSGAMKHSQTTENPYGYYHLLSKLGKPGACRGENNCIIGDSLTADSPYTLASCVAQCSASSKCIALVFGPDDGFCGLAWDNTKCPKYITTNGQDGRQCWNRLSEWVPSPFDRGDGDCTASCPGTCAYKGPLGQYTRNFYGPTPKTCAAPTPAPKTGSPATSAPSTPLPPGTSVAPDTLAPKTGSPATNAPATPAPPGASVAPDTPAPKTDSPATPAPPGTTTVPDTRAPPGTTTVPSTPAPPGTSSAPVTNPPRTGVPSTAAPATPAPNTPAPISVVQLLLTFVGVNSVQVIQQHSAALVLKVKTVLGAFSVRCVLICVQGGSCVSCSVQAGRAGTTLQTVNTTTEYYMTLDIETEKPQAEAAKIVMDSSVEVGSVLPAGSSLVQVGIPSSSSSSGTSAGLIAGIVVGVVVAIGACVAAVVIYLKRRESSESTSVSKIDRAATHPEKYPNLEGTTNPDAASPISDFASDEGSSQPIKVKAFDSDNK